MKRLAVACRTFVDNTSNGDKDKRNLAERMKDMFSKCVNKYELAGDDNFVS